MKRAVITGPTGAIGTALIEKLRENRIKTTAVVRPGSTRADRIIEDEYVKKIECNLDNLSELKNLIPEGADIFYHFGWDGTFGNSRNNMHGQNLNVKYALDAVDAASDLGCSLFVGAGSQAEYGRVEGKLNSDTPAFPENGYGMAKLCAGQMTRVACSQKGMRHVWVRILSIYGPYDGDKTMVMSTINKLLSGERASCTKGEQMWDYLYSRDAADAFVKIGLSSVKENKIYCLGSGQVRPLREYIEDIRNEVAPEVDIGFGEVPYNDKQVMYLCADISELTKDTGFVPVYSFKEGIKETADWCRRQMKG